MILIDLKTLIKLEIEKLLSVLFFFRLVSPINKVLAKTNTASKMKTNEYDNRSDIRPPITMPQLYPAIFPAAIVDKSLTRKSAFFSNIAHNFVDEINAAMPKPSTPLANENLNKSSQNPDDIEPIAANTIPNIINFFTPNLSTANKQINKPIIVAIALNVVGKLTKKFDTLPSLLNN